VIEQDLMALGVVLAVTAASPNRPTAMAASPGTRMKTSPSTGPDDHNTRNYLGQDTGCTLSERRAAGRICSVVSGLRDVTVTCDRHGGEHHALPG